MIRLEYPPAFQAFWDAYPAHRRGSKKGALDVWKRLKVNADDAKFLTEHVTARKAEDPAWLKEGGQFIPHAERFLSKRRFEDEWDVPSQPLINPRRRAL